MLIITESIRRLPKSTARARLMLGLYVCLFTPCQKKQTGQQNKLKQILNRLEWLYLYRFFISEHCSHITIP